MTSDTETSDKTTAKKTEDSVTESETAPAESMKESENNPPAESQKNPVKTTVMPEQPNKNPMSNQPEKPSAPETQKPEKPSEPATEKPNTPSEPVTEPPETTSEPVTTEPSIPPKEEDPVKQMQFYITANKTTFTVDFADNSNTDALRELLSDGDLTIDMRDYGSFEKVGSIGQSLPRKDTQISTTTGDIMLYQGNQIVIFYGNNSWSYSRIGKIQNATKDDLLAAFGNGDVAVTFSLTKPE